MHRRPNLQEAISVLHSLSADNEDALQAVVDYNSLIASGEQFTASRMVVDIVDHYYHLLSVNNVAHA